MEMNRITKFRLKLENMWLQFQPDCGSSAVLINRFIFNDLQKFLNRKIKLQKDFQQFYAANLSEIFVDGYFIGKITTESGASCESRIYVQNVPKNEPPLLNEATLLKLGLINYNPKGKAVKQVSQMSPEDSSLLPEIKCKSPEFTDKFEKLHKKYIKVFTGMGLLRNYEVDFKLTQEVEFFYRPPIVPIHLREKATERLLEFVRLGLFEFVPPGEPVKYSSALLVIDEGLKVRFTGDYRYLNQFIANTTVTPPQKLENYLEKMQGARWFLKTDLNKGYWQLRLSEKSKELCTLSTHLGCVRPNRVPMGVKISGELFDSKMPRSSRIAVLPPIIGMTYF